MAQRLDRGRVDEAACLIAARSLGVVADGPAQRAKEGALLAALTTREGDHVWPYVECWLHNADAEAMLREELGR